MARCCTLQVLLLVALVRLFSCEPYLRQLAASNDSNDTNSSTTTTSTGASCDSNTTNCTSPATTTSATTTTPAATTTTSSRAVVGTPAQDDSTLIIVIAVVCSLVAMAAGSLCVYGVIAYMQSSEVENRKLVKQIDSDAAGFETYLSNVANNVQRFNHRLDKDKALKEQFEKEVTAFAKDWQKVEEDSREFLDKQYTPCLRARLELQQAKDLKRRRLAQQRRQAAELKAKAALDQQVRQKRKELDLEEKKRIKEGQPPRTPDELNALAAEAVRVGQAESGRAKSLMIGASSANLVQEEEVGCCPGFPVTSNSELRKQIKRLAELQNLHANSITQLKQLRDQIWPSGGSGLEDLDLPAAPTEAPKPAGWWGGGAGAGAGRNQGLEGQVEVIKNFAHPLLNKIEVKPYSVLGTTDKDSKELAPFTPIEAVVVDPAGYNFIGYRNSARGAGAASGSIYKWLNLMAPPANGRFPPEVNRHFSASREAEAEGRAKFFAYAQGQMVVHTIGPKLRELLPGLQCLSRTYLSVLTEFCEAILRDDARKARQNNPSAVKEAQSKGSSKSGRRDWQMPRVLRMCPISSGLFCEDARLQTHMADLTWAAVSLALAMLPAELQDLLGTLQLEMCVFQTREFPVYQAALAQRQLKVAGPPKFEADRGRVASRSAGSGGFDWVRKQNQPQDRLERLQAFMNTAQATASGGYALQGAAKQLTIKPMLEGTRICRAPAKEEPGAGAASAASANEPAAKAEAPEAASAPRIDFDQDGLTVIDAAVKVQKSGRAAVGVNAASAYSVGGGVLSGGRHALEESCCITSTLLASLQKAQWDQLHSPEEEKPPSERGSHWRAEEEGPHAHVPVDGCIVSPAVEVFREGSNNGYGFFETPVRLQGFCSVAMFNMNPRVSDSPLDAPREFKAYCHQVKQKFRAIVASAVQLGAEVLVCPDVGCGVFGNDPQVLGTLFGEVLREPLADGALKEVLLTGQVAFAEAVKKAAAGEKVELKPPAYFATGYGAYGAYGGGGGKRQGSHGRQVKVVPVDQPNPTVVVATVASPATGTRPGGGPVGAVAAQPAGAGPAGGATPAPVAVGGAVSPTAAPAAAPAVAVGASAAGPALAASPAPVAGLSPAAAPAAAAAVAVGAEAASNPGEVPAGAGAGSVM